MATDDAPATATARHLSPAVRDRRLGGRHDHRVVRLLPVRRPRRVLQHPVLPARQRRRRPSSRRSRRSAPGSPSGRSARPFFGRIGDLTGRKFTFLADDHGHGPLDGPRRHPADLRPDRHPRPDHPRDASASPRASRSAASTAARRSMSRSTAPTTSAARTRAGSRRRRRSACCSPSSVIAITRTVDVRGGLRELRLADPVPPLGRSSSCSPCTSGSASRRRRCSARLKAQGKSSTSPWRESFGNARQPRS